MWRSGISHCRIESLHNSIRFSVLINEWKNHESVSRALKHNHKSISEGIPSNLAIVRGKNLNTHAVRAMTRTRRQKNAFGACVADYSSVCRILTGRPTYIIEIKSNKQFSETNIQNEITLNENWMKKLKIKRNALALELYTRSALTRINHIKCPS